MSLCQNCTRQISPVINSASTDEQKVIVQLTEVEVDLICDALENYIELQDDLVKLNLEDEASEEDIELSELLVDQFQRILNDMMYERSVIQGIV